MVALVKQTEFGGTLTDRDEELEIEAGYAWRDQLWSSIRTFIIGFIDIRTGLKGYDGCSYHLNKRWEPKGRSVTAGALRSALHDSERNNFRAEWLDWFAAQDRDIADLLARRVKPIKTDAERIADLEAELREELSHKRAEAVLRRARAR